MPPRLCNIFPLPASHPLHQWAVEVLGTYLCNIFYFWFFTSPQNLMSGFNFCLYFPNFIWLFLPLTQFLLSFFFFFFFFFFGFSICLLSLSLKFTAFSFQETSLGLKIFIYLYSGQYSFYFHFYYKSLFQNIVQWNV